MSQNQALPLRYVKCLMFPIITAVCILVVATTTVCVGLSLNRDADCPSGTSLSRFPTASSWQQCGLACHRCNTYALCFCLDNIAVRGPAAYSSNTVAGSYHSSGLPSVLPLVLSILEFGILVLKLQKCPSELPQFAFHHYPLPSRS